MNYANIPGSKFQIAWGASAGGSFIRPIPQASQIGIQAGAASLTDGFPPLNFSPVASGGVPPFGQDFNGIFNLITLWNQWQQAGAPVQYDSGFSTGISGYPKGAVLVASTLDRFWFNMVDANTTNPDTGGANWGLLTRLRLNANTTFFVATTGSDTTGIGTVGNPWATVTKAAAVIQQLYDLNGFVATISVADGTYAAVQTITGSFLGANKPANVVIAGNVGTPSNVLFSGGMVIQNGAQCTIQNFKVSNGAGGAIFVDQGGNVVFAGTMVIGACVGGNGVASSRSSIVFCTSTLQFTGNIGLFAFTCSGSSSLSISGTVNIAASLSFAVTAEVESCSNITSIGASFTGSTPTAARYQASLNGTIFTNGAGATYFPGTTGGSVATGGQYA